MCQKGGDACIASPATKLSSRGLRGKRASGKQKRIALAKRAQQNSGWRAKTARRCDVVWKKSLARLRLSAGAHAVAREMERPIARAATDQQASQTGT